MDFYEQLRSALIDRYSIERELGSGGMAVVYLARDLKHERRVAVKVLQPELAAVIGGDRFLREIRIAANLNHPHILPLHDSGQANGFLYYVMPYVEGESLRDKLNREAQLPIEEAIRITQQAASALESAHGEGVIHRDIKPENILLQKGEVLVADFGIALAVRAAGGHRLTESGLSLGTPQYMSPEQASADRHIDARTDIYSLGSVLYEMLVGEPPFTGPNVQAIIAKLLSERAPGVRSARDTVPPAVEQTVMKTLAKLPADRFATAQEFADTLTRASTPGFAFSGAVFADERDASWQGRLRRALPWAFTALLTVVAGVALWGPWRGDLADELRTVRLTINLPPGDTLVADGNSSAIALSPDGTKLVYKAKRNDTTRLFLRELNSFETTAIAGTHNVTGQPFFSPNGNSIGFFQDSMMRRVSLAGGSPIGITDAVGDQSADWGSDDAIVFSAGGELNRIGLSGGPPELIVASDLAGEYFDLRYPEVLPDVGAVLFSRHGGSCGWSAAIHNFETGTRKLLLEGARSSSYAPTGHVVYAQEGALLAVPFDLRRLEPRGPAVSVVDGVRMIVRCGAAHFSLSKNGTLAYVPGGQSEDLSELVWVDRQGNATLITDVLRQFNGPHISADGRRLVWWEGGDSQEWLFDVVRGSFTQLTTEGRNYWPIWTPSGRRVTFPSMRPQGPNLFWKPWDGSEPAERLTTSENMQQPMAWLADETALIYQELDPDNGYDIWILPLDGDHQPRPLVNTTANEYEPSLSPDGEWFAYVSDESGANQVYIKPFPGPGGRVTVSIDGGHEPAWAPNGQELFYRSGDMMMALDIVREPEFAVGNPRVLFTGRYVDGTIPYGRSYDIAPDGERFVMVRPAESRAPSTRINVILNWFDELKTKVPVGN